MEQQPVQLTVVMPVYNAGKYLREAIDSILLQTFTDFEFLLIDDGSTDDSKDIIAAYNDDRIRLICNDQNRGIAYCRNLGIELSETEFIAWCDADDISKPRRFEEQIKFLQIHANVVLCGTWLERIGEGKRYTGKASSNPEIIKAKLLFKPLVFNATTMWRLPVIKQHGLLFDETLPIAEDYDFYSRCAFLFDMSNVQQSLYLYRWSETSILKNYPPGGNAFFTIHRDIYNRALVKLGMDASESELRIHNLVGSEQLIDNMEAYKACFSWLQKIKRYNVQNKLYDNAALEKVLGEEFLFVSKKASALGLQVFWFYCRNCTGNFTYANFREMLKLLARCLIKYRKF